MIVLVGASASGKTEIAKYLREHFGIVKAVTHTSRTMRVNEVNDVDYHFVSKEQFLALKEKDAFVETTFYNGNYYGCSKAEISDEKDVIVDPNGLHAFLALHDPHVITFYLYASEATRRKRMAKRLDDPKDIDKRIENDRASFAEDKLSGIHFRIDTEGKEVAELGDLIHSLYLKAIA